MRQCLYILLATLHLILPTGTVQAATDAPPTYLLSGELFWADDYQVESPQDAGNEDGKLGVGLRYGYPLSEYWGIEAGISHLSAEVDGQTPSIAWQTDIDLLSFPIGVEGHRALSEHLSGYAKLGGLYWKSDTEAKKIFPQFGGISSSGSFKESGFDLYYEAGLRYTLSPDLWIDLGYAHQEHKDLFDGVDVYANGLMLRLTLPTR